MKGATVIALVTVATVPACSPFGRGAFHCDVDADCANGTDAGYCEQPVGLCAFDDGDCPLGRRYGASSGDLANQCVTADNTRVDAATVDVDPNDLTGCVGVGTPLVVCPVDPLTTDLTVTAVKTYVTDEDSSDCLALRPPGATNICAIGGRATTIDAAIAATGSRPFVIISAGDLTTNYLVDVTSYRALNRTGAGAGIEPGCTSNRIDPGGGGAGGSYGSLGGAGGKFMGSSTAQMPGSTTGFAFTGGCPGHAGALGSNDGGAGGAGGGALALIATGTLMINAAVAAGGEGGASGSPGESGAGGGGGGTGGTILLEGDQVNIVGDVYANGGAGAEGTANNTTTGCTGYESTGANIRAVSPCSNSISGGDGGSGGIGLDVGAQGADGTAGGGGGGGGGGVGAIDIVSPNQPSITGTLSPHP